MDIREINCIDEVDALQESWRLLLQKTPGANFFQSLEWLRTYWQHFGNSQHLRVLVVEQQGEITGILPLVVRLERTKVGSLDYLTYPLDYWGSFYGPIGPDPDQVLAAGLEYLHAAGLEADVLELRWLGDQHGECDRAEHLLRAAGYAPMRSQFDSTSVVNFSGTWEDYLASRTSKWRNNYRRWNRQLNALGEVTHLRFRPDANEQGDLGWEYYDECLRIAAASWQGASQTGTTLTHEAVAPYLKDTHATAARCGCIDLNLLYLDGRAIAFAYNYVFQGHVYGLRVGYDPDLSCKGAGNLLYAKMIEDSYQRGDWRHDLGPRHLECKRALVTDVLPIYRLSCYKSWSVRQQLLRLKRQWDARNLEPACVPVPELPMAPMLVEH
ncbi:MAG: GNAT family N-acetyltransferase [Planctomycetales bacterium]|nr:GNAT family N-acetyltransferase [Planctomycetales bacterium]